MFLSSADARLFDEHEALRGGCSEQQLDRQIGSQFYERTVLSRTREAMLRKGSAPQPGDLLTPEEEIKDPLVLAFLNLKDEYLEHDLEEALIHKLEDFVLEPGGDFALIGLQKRLRIGDEWYRVDLPFFPPPPALPGRHRPEDWQVHPWRVGADAPLPEWWLTRRKGAPPTG
jgi:predicted nuclease of restriction endonuclease-like (RecB) superfamily